MHTAVIFVELIALSYRKVVSELTSGWNPEIISDREELPMYHY